MTRSVERDQKIRRTRNEYLNYHNNTNLHNKSIYNPERRNTMNELSKTNNVINRA